MKIEEQVLSIEQMKHLQELGVDTSDASMYWVRAKRMTGGRKNDCIGNDEGKWRLSLSKDIVLPAAWTRESVPTYTIGDLIEKLPEMIGIYHLMIDWNFMRIEYTDWSWIEIIFRDYFNNRPFINALYDCLCWVAEKHKELLEVRND